MANRELYDLSMTLANGLIVQEDGSKETMIRYKDVFKNQSNTTLSTFVINSTSAIFTKKHLRQIMMYYLDKDRLFFDTKDVIEGSNDTQYIFTFGEIVANCNNGKEVVVAREYVNMIEYVIQMMLDEEDDYIVPKIATKALYQITTSPRCFTVDVDNVTSLYNEYKSIFDNID